MLGCVAKTICCAARGQFWIINKFHDRGRHRLTVTRLNEQTILAILNYLWNISYVCRDHGTAAGEGFTQDYRRCFGASRSNHNHVARRVNAGRVPAISRHDDFVGQSGLIDRVPYIDAAFQNPGALTYDDEAGIGAILQNNPSRFDQNELAFIWPNHAHVSNKRSVVGDADFMPEFRPVARRLELFQIDRGPDDLNLGGINPMFLYQLAFDHRCVGDDLRTAVFEHKCATFVADWVRDTARAAERNATTVQGQTEPMIFRAVSFEQINFVSSAKSPEPP